MKIVHAADLHIDSPMRGLERYEGAPVEPMRAATRRATEALVELCLDEEAELLLLAGDLFDGDWKDYSTGLFFAQQMSLLRQADVRVVWLRGNHDAASHIRKHLQLPSNVQELSTKRPETLLFEDIAVAVHGQGFAKRVVRDDLARRYPEPLQGAFNVGLLHTSIDGREGHDDYAPCDLETLVQKGYDYWALGHVHQREVLHEWPWVVFPGNLQGRHIRETGAKGATLITIEDGEVRQVEHRPLDAARWERVHVNASESTSPHDVVDLVRDQLEQCALVAAGRPLAVRVEVAGRSRAHDALLADVERWEAAFRASATDAGEVWIERVRLITEPVIDVDDLAQRDDAIGQIVRSLRSLRDDEERVAELIDELAELRSKLPGELRERRLDGGLRLDDPATVGALVEDAEQLLLARLMAVPTGGDS